MTRNDVTRALRRFWPLALLVLAFFLAIGAAASFLPKKHYQATALLFAQPTSAQALNNGTVTVVALVLPTLEQQVATQRFENQVLRASPAAAGAKLSASSAAGTAVLTVTAESTDPHTAALAANAAAQQLHRKPLTTAIKLTVLNPAFTPGSPSSPRKEPILLGCLVLGLIVALFSALVADALRKRVAGAATIRESFGLTVLGEVTQTRRFKRRPAELFGEGGSRELSEEYQRLRTNFELLASNYHTIAVTSWTQGEGKTTVTANLGWMLASLGREVTIVDFDLRRPSIHLPFGLDVAGGVAELGNGSANGTAAIRAKPTDLAGLEIVTAGTPVEQPARVIERALPQVAQALENRLVLIDTPPLLAAETPLIASMVDALVIVIDVRRREPAELEAELQVLKLTQTTIIGVVLNRIRRGAGERQTPGYYYASPRRAHADIR
ncbi:MAG TPA: P-loop NTPase [Solirubrobacteraceae bacterium]|jgi:capsular exopolysaccharide synthesis family protein